MKPEPDEYAERARLDALFHAIFVDDIRGATIFEDLHRRFYVSAKVHTDGGIDAVLKTYRDAARREVIDYINLRTARHEGAVDEPQQPQEKQDVSTL